MGRRSMLSTTEVQPSTSSTGMEIAASVSYASDIGTQTSPRRLKKCLSEIKMKRRIKVLQQQLRRRDNKIRNMKDLIKYLKANNKCHTSLEDVLINNIEGFSLELFKSESANLKAKATQRRYTQEMKEFALTLYFYSPKSYRFVRSKICLPHSAVIRKWLSSRNCEVGFLTEVFNFLKEKISTCTHLQNVALMFDAMAIRSEAVFDKKKDKYSGYVDFGGISNICSEEMATEALVFQVVSYSRRFKCPIAYFYTNKITATLQSRLILLAIQKLFEVGMIVRSITCDGPITNSKTLEILGCNLSPENMIPKFKHPQNGSQIYCILDPCHMLKLCRNAFAEVPITSPAGEISFKYVQKLHDKQEEEDLKLANRLSGPHINFHHKKMNVRLAAQTIGSGVANAIDFLRLSGHRDFIGSEATTEFLRIFDFMNSRNAFGKGYKSPLYLNNKNYWQNVFQETENYIRQLKIRASSILHHPRKTFALGFLANIFSFQNLALDLLANIEKPLKFFLAYKCSQDHLELYFSCIRSRGGWNNNPNTMQFKWALRQLLFRNSVTASINSNCVDGGLNSTPLFNLCNGKRSTTMSCDADSDEMEMQIRELMSHLETTTLSYFQENVLSYIGGFILRKFIGKLDCVHCQQILIQEFVPVPNYTVNINQHYAFTRFVSKGKLYVPSQAVFEIIKFTEKAFRVEIALGYATNQKFKQRILSTVMRHFFTKINTLFQPPHPVVDVCEDVHEVQIIKYISNAFADTRIYTYAKKKTLKILGTKATIRQKLHNSILFYHV